MCGLSHTSNMECWKIIIWNQNKEENLLILSLILHEAVCVYLHVYVVVSRLPRRGAPSTLTLGRALSWP